MVTKINLTDHAVHGMDLDASDPNYEYWSKVVSVISEGPYDLTYRGNGEKLLCWSAVGLHTNSGDLDPGLASGKKLFIFTNPVNKRDIITSWHCNVSGGGVAVCRELYP